MANIDQAECKRILDAVFGVAAYVAPTTVGGAAGAMKLKLTSDSPTSTGSGTEVANAGGSTYAPQTVTMRPAVLGSPTQSTNNGIVSFTNMPAGTVTGVNIVDASATPRRAMFGNLSVARTTSLGDTLSFADSAIAASLQ